MYPTRHYVQMELDRLKSFDPELKISGASTHRYRLNPPLQELEVVNYETCWGVQLPAEFRHFVTQVGDGGAGPCYGINSLREVEEMLLDNSGEELEFDPGRPFGCPTTVEEARRIGEFPTHGLLPLAEIGCGMCFALITAGTERGNMWSWGNDDAYHVVTPNLPVYPPNSSIHDRERINDEFDNEMLSSINKVRMNFLDWYLQWLHQTTPPART